MNKRLLKLRAESSGMRKGSYVPYWASFSCKYASYPLLHPDLPKATRKGQEHFLAPS
ncbi:MAG: hypothetical protein J6O18_04060 [Bacilli bacterium]|nr:hypothetical protein [Bacilli bacterium]